MSGGGQAMLGVERIDTINRSGRALAIPYCLLGVGLVGAWVVAFGYGWVLPFLGVTVVASFISAALLGPRAARWIVLGGEPWPIVGAGLGVASASLGAVIGSCVMWVVGALTNPKEGSPATTPLGIAWLVGFYGGLPIAGLCGVLCGRALAARLSDLRVSARLGVRSFIIGAGLIAVAVIVYGPPLGLFLPPW